MSSKSNIINDSSTGWTTVRSKNLIKKISSRTNSPEPQDFQPVVENMLEPIEKMLGSVENVLEPVEKMPRLVENVPKPVENAPEPVENVPEPVENVPGSVENTPEPVKNVPGPVSVPVQNFSPIPMSPIFQSNGDWWQNMFEFLKVQKSMLDNNIQYIGYELQFPSWLRGKSPIDKDKLVNDNLYNLIEKMLPIIKDEIVKSNKWVDTINSRKITGMFVESFNIGERINLLYNPDELTKNVKESCEVLFQKTITVENDVDYTKKTQSDFTKDKKTPSTKEVKDDSTESNSKKNDYSKSDVENISKFSYDERVDHKKSLLAAQEKFFESCILSSENVKSFKENIEPIPNWSGTVNSINLSNDDIKIDKYSFSKKHFLKNSWFRNRLMEKYCKLFDFDTVELILPKGNSNVLIIQGSF